MLVTDLFTKILGEIVYPPILQRGFSLRTRDNSLRRWYGDRYDFFWFQCDWDKDFGVIEGGVCVGFKSVAQFLKKCPPIRDDDIGRITNTAQPICAVSGLHALATPPRVHSSWVVTPDTDATELGDEISTVCLNGGLSFFERFATIPAVIDYWKAKRRVKELSDFGEFQLAAALWMQDERADAIRGLEFLVEWRRLSVSESPRDARDFQVAMDVLQWFKTLG